MTSKPLLTETNKSCRESKGDLGGLSGHLCSRFEYNLTQEPSDQISSGCLVVTASSSKGLSAAALNLDSTLNGLLSNLLQRGSISGREKTALFIPLHDQAPAEAVLVLGVGDEEKIAPSLFRTLAKTAYRQLNEYGIQRAALYLGELDVEGRDSYWKVRLQIQCMEEMAYQFRPGNQPAMEAFDIYALDVEDSVIAHGKAFGIAVNTTRRLGDTPPNVCSPSFIAAQAEVLAQLDKDLHVDILEEADMQKLGMNSMLSVGQGSAEPSKLVVMKYSGASDDSRPTVLIGKGVTFDTGGTALKDRSGMRLMKYDMCGAATVVGIMSVASMLELPINLIGICACAENMPSGNASRPSDVVRSMSGKTVEILNPDAEGRLLLCDALTYAERFAPDLVVDIATLTGASIVALGNHYSAMYTNRDSLSQQLSDAGEMAMDKVWRLPLSEEDFSQLDSEYADIANMGNGTAASVVAALFLSSFATAYPWVHLDVSGTAKNYGDRPSASGRPTSLLLQLLLNKAS